MSLIIGPQARSVFDGTEPVIVEAKAAEDCRHCPNAGTVCTYCARCTACGHSPNCAITQVAMLAYDRALFGFPAE